MGACVKCGLPETYQKIVFDEYHVCNFCRFYEKHRKELSDFAALEAQIGRESCRERV